MSGTRIGDVKYKNNQWYRIIQELLDKADVEINGPQPWDIQIKNPDTFHRVIQEGTVGMGEAYMDGWWECERLDMFFHRAVRVHLDKQLPYRYQDTLRIIIARIFNLQSYSRAATISNEHYSLCNDLFVAILDPYMQYSCGYWKYADTLEQAQEDKLSMICEKLQLKPGMTLLDIGCGWGGLAEFAARRHGVKVTGVTISPEQQSHAQKQCEGLDARFLLQDYRDPLDEQFDRVVSVAMFEHVGHKNHAEFFRIAERSLKPNGLFLLHTIGSNKSAEVIDAWINKYIFPNFCFPCIQQIADVAEQQDFIVEDWHNFGADYDRTMMAWYRRFLDAWPQLEQKYDERFKRMVTYYFNCSAGAFRARDYQLWQIVFSRGVEGGLRVSHL